MVTAEEVRGRGRAGVAASPGPEARVLDAATTCIARWGVSKTTLDDVAREAGVSRATVYRLFPGGKSALLTACGAAEVSRLLLILTAQIEAATSLERLLMDLIGGAARFIADNDAIQMLLRHEPDVLLPFVAFDRQGPLLEGAVAFLAPHLERFVDRRTARETVEWVARLVISYTFTPAATIDLCDEVDVRRLVTNQLMPGIALASAP